MAITTGPDEIARRKATLLRDHLGQQGVRRDVERHAQEDVGAALVQLARQAAVGHVELEHRMAGRERHLGQLGHVPGRDDQPTGVRVRTQPPHQVGDLVDVRAIGRRPRAPLVAVDRAEFALCVGPLVPDRHAVGLQVRDVGGARQEPQQLVHDRLQVDLLRGHQRKALGEREPHLPAEHRAGAGPGAVGLQGAVLEHVAHQVEVGTHRRRGQAARPRKQPATICSTISSSVIAPPALRKSSVGSQVRAYKV